jgi:predicted amidohydrolase
MKVALIQLKAGSDKQKNIDHALRMTIEPVRKKAQFILFPEVFNYRGPLKNLKDAQAVAETIPGPSTVPFMLFARAHKVFILLGSLYEKAKGKKKIFNTSVLINDEGKIIARYRKMNLFDATIGKKKIKESRLFIKGKTPRLVSLKGFKIGMSICYDLRFPHLYRRYARAGANILCIPSVFTRTTGQAHWEVLLRARAIENLSYVLAPNQVGRDHRRITAYGNSMVVDPWGKIVIRASRHRDEVVYANITLDRIRQAKKILPAIP